MISRRTNNRCDGKFGAKFNCKYRSVIVTDKTTILTLKNETKTRKVLPLCPCKYPIFYLHSKQDFFSSSLRNMQLGDVGNQQKKNCEKMNEITTCCNKLVS